MSNEQQIQSVQLVTIGTYARALIKHCYENNISKTNEELAAKVVAKFKEHGVETKTSANCIAWYKNDMRKKNLLPKGNASGKKIELNLDNIDV